MTRTTKNKTQPTGASVDDFIDNLDDEQQRDDARELLRLMRRATKQEPQMWGKSIVGFGTCVYKYASGREGEWPMTGFSPRKTNLTVYILSGLRHQADKLRKLGKHKTGMSCLYIRRLSDVDLKTLESIVKQGVVNMKKFGYNVMTK